MEYKLNFVAFLFYILIFSSVSGDIRKIEFVKQPRNQISVENSDVMFECSAVTTPTEKVSYLWKKDGEYIDTSKIPRASVSSDGKLAIKSIFTEDFGVYECVAMCDEGALLSRPAKLEKPALSLTGGRAAVHVKEGGYHLYRPMISSNVDVHVEWKLCSQLKVTCIDIDQSRMLVTANWELLISPILSADDTFYPKITVYGGKYFQQKELRMGTISITEYLHNNWKRRCPDPSPLFLQTRAFTVYEGSNLTVNCLAVMKRCENILAVKWKDRLGDERSTSRTLQLINVTKADEGLYTCIIDAHGDPSHSYQVTVIEKPKLVTEPPDSVVLRPDRLVSAGVVTGADSVDWYTNAEKIARNSRFYEFFPTHQLKILPKSSALSGFYQIVYKNEAGIVMRTVKVDIPNSICGDRSDDFSDDIKFLRQGSLPKNRIIHCVWLLQTFSLSTLNFYFTQFIFRSTCNKLFLDVHDGLEIRNSTQKYHFCSSSVPNGVLKLSGPFITMYLKGNSTELGDQGFEVIYGPNITIPKTPSTLETSSRTKPTTPANTTVHSSTRKQPRNHTTGSMTVGTVSPPASSTTALKTASGLSTKMTKKTATSKVKTYSTSKTIKHSTKKSDKTYSHSVIPPKKAGQGTSSNSDIALYISIIAVGFILVIIIGAFYYRRKKLRACHAKEAMKTEVLLAANKSNSNDYRRGESFPSKETCFTINGHAKFGDRSIVPGAVPTLEPRGYKTMNSRIQKDFTLANYTALQFEMKGETHPYASIDINSETERNGVTTAATYATISAEDDAQYMPICESNFVKAYPVDKSLSAPSHDQQNGQPGSVWPVYQELEVEAGCQHRRIPDKVNDGRSDGAEMTGPVDHTYAETIAEPFYHVLSEKKPDTQKCKTLDLKKEVDTSDAYLVPRRSKNLPRDYPQEQAYLPPHYIQPNPVDIANLKARSQHEQCEAVDGGSRKTSSVGEVSSVPRYEPITSEDDMYLAIMK